jgi:hypothetical protein
MAGNGTMSASDLYGANVPGRNKGDAALQPSALASGPPSASSSKPAMSWLGMILALVILRVAWEFAK